VNSAGNYGLLYCLAEKGVCSLAVGNVFIATAGEVTLGYVRWSRPVGWTGVYPLNAELNPICHLLALLGGATIVVVSRLRVK
jgi:hypothetical protein